MRCILMLPSASNLRACSVIGAALTPFPCISHAAICIGCEQDKSVANGQGSWMKPMLLIIFAHVSYQAIGKSDHEHLPMEFYNIQKIYTCKDYGITFHSLHQRNHRKKLKSTLTSS